MATFPKEVDVVLSEFCREFGLHLHTSYRDEEVRSIDVIDDQSSSYQIWLEHSDFGWTVKLWDRDSRSAELAADADDLLEILRSTYRELEGWIGDVGHTRNWFR